MMQLCASQQMNDIPFIFQNTKIRVFSIEEALYHVYHYWRESAEDFCSTTISTWVTDIGHPDLSKKIATIKEEVSFSKRLLAFLNIIEYFDESDLANIKPDLLAWENRVEWERLKDRADGLVSRGQPAKALPLYQQALSYKENATLLNNIAITYIQIGNHTQGIKLLARAHILEPDNKNVRMHYAEALILANDYKLASQILPVSDEPDTLFLYGLMAYQQGDYPTAYEWLKKANDDPTFRISRKISEIFMKMNQPDKALTSLNTSDPTYHERMSEIYASCGHAKMPEAIDHIKKAIIQDQNSVSQKGQALWTKLAKYYRLDFDWTRAAEAIENALSVSSAPSASTILEHARIKKGQGRMRDYRASLGDMLRHVKDAYRQGVQ